jgi:hypothetical protein
MRHNGEIGGREKNHMGDDTKQINRAVWFVILITTRPSTETECPDGATLDV